MVAFHDENIEVRTSGTGNVSDLTLVQLQSVHLLLDPPENILSLDEVFKEFYSPNLKWILDVKVKGIETQLLTWITEKFANSELSQDRVIIFGTYDTLLGYKDSGIALGYTALWSNSGNQFKILFAPSQIIQQCQTLRCKHLVLPVIFANASLVQAAKSSGIETWVYGTGDLRDFQYLAKNGVSGFIVDHPAVAIKYFRK